MENQTNPNFFNSDKINEIKDLFLLITIHLNENIELKFNLLSKKDFSPTQLFDSLDNFSKKNLTVQDILHYLEHHNYKINTELIQRLIKQYDKNGNYNLIYDDFLQMISPFGLQVFSVNSLLGDKGENADEIFCQKDILEQEKMKNEILKWNLDIISHQRNMTLKKMEEIK